MTHDQIQYIGHGSLWITLDSEHLIVDTNFSKRLLGIFKRRGPVGIDVNHLPNVSGLLVTHAHYDHLDIFSYKYFSQDKPIITPPGIGGFIKRFLHNPLVELNTWQTHPFGPITVTAVPTKHRGGRWSCLRYSKCHGYIVQGTKHTIYLAGDSGMGNHFEEIGKKYKIDVACLPIGFAGLGWLSKKNHMEPHEALKAFKMLGAQTMIPIRWGTFRLSTESLNRPIEELKKELNKSSDHNDVKILQTGESFQFPSTI